MIVDLALITRELHDVLAASEAPRLDHLALAIAGLDDEPVDAGAVLAKLDGWGERVRLASQGSRYVGVEAIEGILAGEEGLRGDDDDYDDPRNSFLPRVLERRRGLPITLSIIYLEVARRAGVPLFGLALPGHFVVGYDLGDHQLVALDPFAGGRILDRPELAAICARAGTTLGPALLVPATPRVIATRMLRNLVGSYQRRRRPDQLRAAAQLLLALEPDSPGLRRILDDAERTDRPLN